MSFQTLFVLINLLSLNRRYRLAGQSTLIYCSSEPEWFPSVEYLFEIY